MLIGPDQVIACPHCGGLAKYRTLLSGNTFGSILLSNGRRISIMMPQSPPCVNCRHCGKCYWLSGAKKIGKIRQGQEEENPEWNEVQYVVEAKESEYLAATSDNLPEDREQERELRVTAWWRHLKPFDESAFFDREAVDYIPQEPASDEAYRANLSALLEFFDENDQSDLLLKAEVLRNLGEFDAANQVLDKITSPELSRFVAQQRAFCEQQEIRTRVFNLE